MAPGSAKSISISFCRPYGVSLLMRGEHAQRRRLEAEDDDLARGAHGLARTQEERHSVPAPVIHLGPHRDHRLGLRVGRHAGLGPVPLVLAAHHVPDVDRLQRLEHLLLLVPQVLGGQRHRRLHGHEPQDLEQVGDDHVPVGAGRVVERGPPLDRERFRHVDLHVAEVKAVPDRLVQPVREPEREDVVDRLLAQEVVDAEHLRLIEDRMHGYVQRARRFEVRAERLLDDHPGALGQPGRA